MRTTTHKIEGKKLSLTARLTGFSQDQELLLQIAMNRMIACFNSKEFKEFVTKYEWEDETVSGWWWNRKTTYWHGHCFRLCDMTRKEVYQAIINGAEVLNGELDNEVDVDIELDRRRNRRVLGYTYANTSTQWIYSTFIANGDSNDFAGNIAHEWCHKLGFGHEYRWNRLRQFTVPYAIGYFVKAWCEENYR